MSQDLSNYPVINFWKICNCSYSCKWKSWSQKEREEKISKIKFQLFTQKYTHLIVEDTYVLHWIPKTLHFYFAFLLCCQKSLLLAFHILMVWSWVHIDCLLHSPGEHELSELSSLICYMINTWLVLGYAIEYYHWWEVVQWVYFWWFILKYAAHFSRVDFLVWNLLRRFQVHPFSVQFIFSLSFDDHRLDLEACTFSKQIF